MNSFANAAPAPGTPVEIKILGEPSPPPGLPPLAPGEPLPENKIPLNRNRLVALLTRLGVPRENYHIERAYCQFRQLQITYWEY